MNSLNVIIHQNNSPIFIRQTVLSPDPVARYSPVFEKVTL